MYMYICMHTLTHIYTVFVTRLFPVIPRQPRSLKGHTAKPQGYPNMRQESWQMWHGEEA